jgi:E3 ubiquitin-protein ligase UBR2
LKGCSRAQGSRKQIQCECLLAFLARAHARVHTLHIQEALAAALPPPPVCGKCTEHGETVFSCADCGADDTCIMCSACFEHSEHRGHNYRMTTSGGSGYCDCGDQEAWSSGATCTLHSAAGDTGAAPPPLPEPFASHAVAFVAAAVADAFSLLETIDYTAVDAIASLRHPRAPNGGYRDADLYVVMIHNDEEHTFDDATRAVLQVKGGSVAEAEEFAKDAHRSGRSMMHVGSREQCALAQVSIVSFGLEARVQRLEVVQEQLALSQLFAWIAEVTALHPALRDAAVGVTLPLDDDDNPREGPTPLARVFEVWPMLPERDRDTFRDAVLSPLLLSPETKLRFGVELFRAYPSVQDVNSSLTTWSVQVCVGGRGGGAHARALQRAVPRVT